MDHDADSIAEKYVMDIKDLVGDNRIDEALSKLQDFIRDLVPQEEFSDSVLLLRARQSKHRRDKIGGTAEDAEANEIIKSLLSLVREARNAVTVKPRYALPIVLDPSPAAREFFQKSPTANNKPVVEAPTPDQRSATQSRLPPEQTETSVAWLRRYWAKYRASRPAEEVNACEFGEVTKRVGSRGFQLSDQSFSIRAGQITGVVGRNASGKTTLLRLVLGELAANAGRIDYPSLTRDEVSWPHIKRQISYVRQSPNRWRGIVKTNLHYIAAAFGSRGKRNRVLVDWYLQRYGLFEYQDYRRGALSGGYQMRYELVRALLSKPRLLVLDEPLAALDVVARQEFLKNLQAIAYSLEEPVPIIVTSQHLYEIEAVADQLIVLDDGKCLYCGSLQGLRNDSRMQLIELNTTIQTRQLHEQLQNRDMVVLETIPDGYIIGISKQTDMKDAMRFLLDQFGNEIVGMRDITGSSRRLFLTNMKAEGAMGC